MKNVDICSGFYYDIRDGIYVLFRFIVKDGMPDFSEKRGLIMELNIVCIPGDGIGPEIVA